MQAIKTVLVSCLLLAGCSSPAADPAVISARDGGNEGAKIYTRNCGKCHEFYPPSSYTQAEWDKWMVKMRRKSKLKPADFDRVQEFTQMLRNGEAEAPKKR
jgi:cytochrome c5